MQDTHNLLLLHGALGSAASFAPFVPKFESDFMVHRIDFEGHGQTPPRGREFRIEHFAENILTYLDNEGLESADIFGYSMGGYVALYLASVAPGRVKSIMTLATKFNWTPETAAHEAAILDPDAMAGKVPAFVESLDRTHTAAGWRWVVESTRTLLDGLGRDPVVTRNLIGCVSCPVRLMVGDRDTMVSLDETRDAFAALQNGELAVLPNTKHPLEKVHPDLLASQARQFCGAGL